jgi:hypothetical protein
MIKKRVLIVEDDDAIAIMYKLKPTIWFFES